MALAKHLSEQGTPLHTTRRNDRMFANLLMLVLFWGMLVVPVLWSLRPARLVTPF
jgi:hypothetical protein